MELTYQVTYDDIILKLVGFGLAVGIFVVYLIYRLFFGHKRFLSSGQMDELGLLQKKQASIKDLQSGPWMANTEMTITYASFGLNVIILAVVFIFEQRLSGYDALVFDILLAINGISVLAYFLSLQFWLLALDIGGSDAYRIRFRHYATVLQTTGWLTLLAAGLFAILIINTVLGSIFSILAIASIIFMFEFKARSSLTEEARNADLNDFQRSFEMDRVYVKDSLPQESIQPAADHPLRVASWNIERGYHPAEIARVLREIEPDIVCLQEVDWNNQRTGNLDVLGYLAQATGMTGLFSLEFHEIQTPLRRKQLAGGGVHGNAILSRWKPVHSFRLDLPEVYDWDTKKTPSRLADPSEKRQGSRHALAAEYVLGGKKVIVCSTHLEDKSGGVAGRFSQYTAIVETIQKQYGGELPVIICGDLNTYANWFTQALGVNSSEQSLGKPAWVPECKWWQEQLLPPLGFVDPFDCSQWTHRVGPLKFKLDWITAKNCEFGDYGVVQQNASDHHLVWAEIRIQKAKKTEEELKEKGEDLLQLLA